MSVNTYPEMNQTIKDLLRMSDEPMNQYILARIEELEAENAALNSRGLEELERYRKAVEKNGKLGELLRLMLNHPDLPVVAMVGEEIVGDCCGGHWIASWDSSIVTRYYVGDERVHFYDDTDEEEVCITLNDKPYHPDNPDAYDSTTEENLAAYRALPWVDAIVVYIETPEV